MFSRKKKFYQTALSIIHDYYRVHTDSRINPEFPSPMSYLNDFSYAYHVGRCTAEEAATLVVLGYWKGAIERRGFISKGDDFDVLRFRMLEMIKSSSASQRFQSQRAANIRKLIDDVMIKYEV